MSRLKTGVNVSTCQRLERLEGPGGHDCDLRFYLKLDNEPNE